MMKNSPIISLIMVLILSLVILGCGQTTPSQEATQVATPAAASEKPIELKLAHMDPAGSFADKHFERWAEKLSDITNGRLKLRIYPGASLISAFETYDAVGKGLCDIGSSLRYGAPGSEFCEVLSTFLTGAPNAKVATRILSEVRVEFSEAYGKEWTSSKVLRISTGGPALIAVKPKAVRTIEDLKGLQIRVPIKDGSEMLKALGGIPVGMPLADLAVGLEKGTVDGAAMQRYSLQAYKVAELTKYVTEFPLYVPPDNFTVMNWDSYNKLPADLQEAIDSTMEWSINDYTEAVDNGDIEGTAYAEGLGVEFITLESDEMARWMETVKPVQEQIAAEMEAKGYPAVELLQFCRGRIAEYIK